MSNTNNYPDPAGETPQEREAARKKLEKEADDFYKQAYPEYRAETESEEE